MFSIVVSTLSLRNAFGYKYKVEVYCEKGRLVEYAPYTSFTDMMQAFVRFERIYEIGAKSPLDLVDA